MNVSFATALKFLSSTAAPETIFQKQKEKHAELSGMKLMCISCLSCSTFMSKWKCESQSKCSVMHSCDWKGHVAKHLLLHYDRIFYLNLLLWCLYFDDNHYFSTFKPLARTLLLFWIFWLSNRDFFGQFPELMLLHLLPNNLEQSSYSCLMF